MTIQTGDRLRAARGGGHWRAPCEGSAAVLAALRSRAAEVVELELVRLAGRRPRLDERCRAEIAGSLRRIVDRLLDTPELRVREPAAGDAYAAALAELFDLTATQEVRW
jgi:glutamyl-tRNA reductase